jgi:hypothetical protein
MMWGDILFGFLLTKTQLYLNLMKCKVIGDEMEKRIISGVFVLLFLGSLLFAQATADIAVQPLPPSGGILEPVPLIPPGLIEARYYEGTAVVHYRNGATTGDPTIYERTLKGKAYVWVERDVRRNLFRGRYAICYESGTVGICEAIATTGWMKGEVRNGVWIIKQGNSVGRLGPEQGFVRLDDGRRIITMTLRLEQPVRIAEPVPPIANPE